MNFQDAFRDILGWGIVLALIIIGGGIMLITGFHFFITILLNGDAYYAACNFVAMLIGLGFLLFVGYSLMKEQKKQST